MTGTIKVAGMYRVGVKHRRWKRQRGGQNGTAIEWGGVFQFPTRKAAKRRARQLFGTRGKAAGI